MVIGKQKGKLIIGIDKETLRAISEGKSATIQAAYTGLGMEVIVVAGETDEEITQGFCDLDKANIKDYRGITEN